MKTAFRWRRISGSGRQKIAKRVAAFEAALRRGDFAAWQRYLRGGGR